MRFTKGRKRGCVSAIRAAAWRAIRYGWVGGLVFLLCLAAGLGYLDKFNQAGGKLSLPTSGFALRAAAFAAGHGWILPDENQLPALRGFASQVTPSFDPAELPAQIPIANDSVEEYHRYLSLSMGLIWRAFGISWKTLNLLPALLLAFSGLACYGLCRLALPRWLSVVGSLLYAGSPALLAELHDIRDFSKTPFVISTIFLMLLLVARPLSRRRYCLLSGLIGALIGLGMGFRQDCLVCLFPALLLVPFFAVAQRPRARILALAALLGGFLLVGGPMLGKMEGGSNPYHPTMMGWGTDSRLALGLDLPAYEQLSSRGDNPVYAAVVGYMERHGLPTDTGYNSPSVVRSVRDWILNAALLTPADVLIRWYAAVRWVLGNDLAHQDLICVSQPGLDKLAPIYRGVAAWLTPLRLFCAGAVLLALAARSWRLATGCAFLLLFVGGYASIAFEYRHAFHLLFVPIVLWLVLAYGLGRGAYRLWHEGPAAASRKLGPILTLRTPGARRAATFFVVAVCALWIPLAAARCYQAHRMTAFLAKRAAASLEPIATKPVSRDGWDFLEPVFPPQWQTPPESLGISSGTAIEAISSTLSWHALLPGAGLTLAASSALGSAAVCAQESQNSSRLRTDYWVAELEASPDERLMLLAYGDPDSQANLTRIATIPRCRTPEARTVRYFFPVHYTPALWPRPGAVKDRHFPVGDFRGVALTVEHAGQLQALYRVSNPSDYEFFFRVALPDVWRGEQRYHCLAKKPAKATRWFCDNSAEARYEAGRDYEADGDLARALACFRAAHVLNPAVYHYPLAVAETLMPLGRPAEALAAYEKALAAAPELGYLFDRVEEALLLSGLPGKKRMDSLLELARTYPASPWPWLLVAREYERKHAWTAALLALNRAFALGMPKGIEDIGRIRYHAERFRSEATQANAATPP